MKITTRNSITAAQLAFAALLLAAVGEIRAADEESFSLGWPRGAGNFAVVNGKPYLLRISDAPGPGHAVDIVDQTRLVHLQSKQPFVYPLQRPATGKPPVVSLGASPATSGKWNLKELTEQPPGGPIQAMEGEYKGWYLEFSNQECELTLDQKTVYGRELILVEKSSLMKKYTKFPVSK